MRPARVAGAVAAGASASAFRRGAIVVLALASSLPLAACRDRAAAAADPVEEAGTEVASRLEAHYLDGWWEAAGDVAAGTTDTRFRRSEAMQRRNVVDFVDDYRPLETLTRARLATLVGSGDALRAFHREMSGFGLDPDDVLDVVALHDALLWGVANRQRVSEADLPAIRDAIAPRVLGMVSRGGMDDAARQRLADHAAMLAAIRSNEYAELAARGDSDGARGYSDLVEEDFLARHGIDLRAGPVATALAAEGRVSR